MGATKQLAELTVKTSFNDIPKETIERAKELVVDFIGAALAGTQTTVGKLITKYVRDMGARPDAGIIAAGYKTTAEYAAFVNGTLNHAAELEAVALRSAPNISMIIAPCLALGEKLRLPGSKVLEGFIIGHELQGKVAVPLMAAASKRGGRIGGFMYLGSAAAASKLLELNVDQTRDAIGIAADHAGILILHVGTMEHFPSKASFDGVEAAQLAKAGLTAHRDVIEAPQGFADAYVGVGPEDYNPKAMVSNFGKPFQIYSPGISIKKYPCCYRSHRALDALFDLINEHGFSYNDVENITVDINQYDSFLMKYTEPKTGIEGRFSFPHVLGTAILNGKVWLDAFTDDAVMSERHRNAQRKVKVNIHPEWPPGRSEARTPITVKLRDGSTYSNEFSSPREPTREELLARYREAARPILSDKQMERSIDLMLNLDKEKNITELMDIVNLTSVI